MKTLIKPAIHQTPALFYTVALAKCPRCRTGNMFPAGTLYRRQFADMYPECSCCGQSFEPEPGFYFGAMYVSFAFSAALFLCVIFGWSFLVKEVTLTIVIITISVMVVGLLPITFRVSRAIWLHIFGRYEGPCSQISKK